MSDAAAVVVLPDTLMTRADLARLSLELEDIDNELEAQKAKHEKPQLPSLTPALGDAVDANRWDLTEVEGRDACKAALRELREHAPVLHLTFAVPADAESLRELVAYARKELHPHALFSVGLQPSLAGGVLLRTPNHVFDLSWRELLASKREVLVGAIEGALHAK